jgi:hypothetical protein
MRVKQNVNRCILLPPLAFPQFTTNKKTTNVRVKGKGDRYRKRGEEEKTSLGLAFLSGCFFSP